MSPRRLLAVAVFALALGAYAGGARTQGNVRDEGYYFDAAELHWGWYGELGDNLLAGKPQKSFSRASVDRWFGYNHEHPGLMKTLFGVSWRVFHKCHCKGQPGHPIGYPKPHRTLGLLSEEAALRLPTHVLSALMVMLTFLLGARLWSTAAGLVAAGLTLGMPRLFFDAQLACFDAPIAALWVAVVYGYFRATQPEPPARRWSTLTGVLFGLALATKHNAFFLPFLLVAHALWVQRHRLRARKLPTVPPVFWWMALVGPVVYLACWPWLWFDTVARFREYVAFHVHHVYYNMEFLGRNYNKPPFPLSYPYVMTALTTPVTTLVLAIGGAVLLLRRHLRAEAIDGSARGTEDTAPGMLLALNALFPLAIITLTRAPIFGATKHWHAALPFLALLAAGAYEALRRALAGAGRDVLAAALGVVVVLPALAETRRSHPYGLTHYNLLAGGPAGGADLGMNRQFWGYATRGLLPYLDETARPGAPVYWHDTNQSQLNMHVREGRLRPDLRNTGLEEPGVKASDVAMVIHERHFSKYEYWIWDFYGTARPAKVLEVEGVPVVTLYERPGVRP